MTNSTGGESSPLPPHREKARPAVVEVENGGSANRGATAAEFEGVSTDIILKNAKQSVRPSVPLVAFAQSPLAAALSSKENGQTGDGESDGGKDGSRIAAIPALPIADSSDRPRLVRMPIKLMLRSLTSG